MRSEDDLRQAFAAKAGEAPDSAGVLRRVSLGIHPRPARRWLVPVAIGATAAAAVAIALPLSLGGGSGHQEAGRAAAPTQAAGQASSSAMALPQPQGPAEVSAGAGRGATAAIGFCRPADVTTTLTVHNGGATLTVATQATACQLARVPRVAWAGAGRVLDARPESSRDADAPPGRLAADSAAVAAIRWSGSCAPAGDTVQIDWGAGPVQVHPTGGASCPAPAAPEDLRVGSFTGLS